MAMFNTVHSNVEDLQSFQEAWHHPDEKKRGKRSEVFRKEFHDMIKREVQRKANKRSIEKRKKLIESKWVFKVKQNGVYRA